MGGDGDGKGRASGLGLGSSAVLGWREEGIQIQCLSQLFFKYTSVPGCVSGCTDIRLECSSCVLFRFGAESNSYGEL